MTAVDKSASTFVAMDADMCVTALRRLHWPVRNDTRAMIDAKLLAGR